MGERALVFPTAKGRPVVITTLAAEAAVLLTLDRTDFHGALGREIYGKRVRHQQISSSSSAIQACFREIAVIAQ